jgi:hypothetical protein
VGLDREWNDGGRVVCKVLLECFCLDGCGHVAVWLGASELGSRGESGVSGVSWGGAGETIAGASVGNAGLGGPTVSHDSACHDESRDKVPEVYSYEHGRIL